MISMIKTHNVLIGQLRCYNGNQIISRRRALRSAESRSKFYNKVALGLGALGVLFAFALLASFALPSGTASAGTCDNTVWRSGNGERR